jgi:hypothetical protein
VGDSIFIGIVSGGVYLSVRVVYFRTVLEIYPEETKEDMLNFLAKPLKESLQAGQTYLYDNTEGLIWELSLLLTARRRNQRISRFPNEPF